MEKVPKQVIRNDVWKNVPCIILKERPQERPGRGWKDHVLMDSEQMG
jgi:hypothetical protein